jgi:ABC-2 type transport system ATP-binding protein
VLTAILRRFTSSGGSVIISSHVMSLVEQLCSRVAIIARGQVLADGSLDEVRGGRTLEDRFVELVGSTDLAEEDLTWIGS